jgi:hypothetical protein
VDRLLGEWGIQKDSPVGRAQFAGLVERRRRGEGRGEYEPEGWWLGSEEFREELMAQVSAQAAPKHAGPEIHESAMAKAENIAQEELKSLGWDAQALRGRRKSDPRKVRIAARLRRETTMTLEWIVNRLCMGAATHVAHLLQHKNDQPSNHRLVKKLCSDPSKLCRKGG